MKTVSWKSLKGVSYTLSITDGVSGTTALTPSATPFVTQVDQSEDFYEPVREQTGNIGILGEVDVLEGLLASSPEDRPVVLKNGNNDVVWKGYLQTRAFSQTWDKGPNEITIPVVSHLGIISSYRLNSTGYMSFAMFFKKLSEATGTAFYSSFVFPNLTDILDILKYKFYVENFAKWDEQAGDYEYEDYREVLEEVCKVFGWVAIEVADTLCLIAPDSTSGYIELTASKLNTLVGGGSPTPTTITQETITETIFGVDHHIDYLPGKKSIKVVGDPNLIDMTIWQLNTSRMVQAATQDHTAAINSGGTRFLHFYSKNYDSDNELQVSNNLTNVKLNNFIAGSEATYSGSSCVCDRQYVTDSNEVYNPLISDTGWMQHIVWKLPKQEAYQSTTIATITPHREHIKNGMFDNCYMMISASVKESTSFKEDWQALNLSFLYMRVFVGGHMIFDDYLQILSGEINAYTVSAMVNSSKGIAMSINQYSGQIEIEFSNLPSQDGLVNDSYWNRYYSLENITVEYIRPWTSHLNEPDTENVYMVDIEGGWEEDLEINNKLTTWHTNQIGDGIILDDDMEPVQYLYSNKTPERALVERMQAHYSTTKQMLTVQLASDGELLSPMHLHSPGSGDGMVCLAQSVDWRNDQITAYLFEM